MGMTSRRKGASGEREVRDALREHGFLARRDGRFDGDIEHNVPGIWLEVKRTERASVWECLAQAARDAEAHGWLVPVIAFRRSRSAWHAILPLDELLRLKRIEATCECPEELKR